MEVRFWGVRGSVASSGSNVARIGGNTSCLEIVSEGHRLILDAGTGIRGLGEALLPHQPIKATMLFSHLHWDHLMGFPFFAPMYIPGNRIIVHGCHANLEEAFRLQMSAPCFTGLGRRPHRV